MLDTLPLLIGISVYMYWWPGRYLTPGSKIDNLDALQADGPASGIHGAGAEASALPMMERELGMGANTGSPRKEDANLPLVK